MKKYQICGALLAVAGLAACASDGSFASKTKPVDLQVSLDRVCTGVRGADLAATGILNGLVASGRANKEDLEVEAAVAKTVLDFCDPNKPPPTDLAGALAAVGVASVDAGDLIAKLSR